MTTALSTDEEYLGVLPKDLTEKMIEAGMDELVFFDPEHDGYREYVINLWIAMEDARNA